MDSRTFVVIGMAGSGKTTFCQRLYSWLNTEVVLKNRLNANITSINLDPAVVNAKMPLTIDIRDKIDYKEIMQKYNLGPNGCINTCLNLFLLDFQTPETSKYTIVDTPGQIEAFTWSSPGDVLMGVLANTCVIYMVDLSICNNKAFFINNMIFAAAIKCKFGKPVLMVFNKADAGETKDIDRCIRDDEYFRSLLAESESELGSLALYFEEFYNSIEYVVLSSLTGKGKNEFFEAVDRIYKTQ